MAERDTDMLRTLEARLSKATWTGRALAVWCALLTWHVLEKGTLARVLGHRNQPLLVGAVILALALAILWTHGSLWARPREGRFRLKE